MYTEAANIVMTVNYCCNLLISLVTRVEIFLSKDLIISIWKKFKHFNNKLERLTTTSKQPVQFLP
jgi:hypothetical protein